MPRARNLDGSVSMVAAANEDLSARPSLSLAEGQALLARQGLAGLRAALGQASIDAPDDNGWPSFWAGYAAQFDDLLRARGHWLRAEARFASRHDDEGAALAACGLAQATVLDNQADPGFDARAAYIERIDHRAQQADAIGLFRVAGKLALAAERREPSQDDASCLARAFAALALPLDAEIRLRIGVAALPLLGVALNDSQVDDFFHAGGALAARADVSDYGRALWHMHVVDALFYDASRGEQLQAELDAIDRLPADEGLRPLRARGQIMRAALLLSEGRAAEAKGHLDAGHRMLDPARPRDYWMLHYYLSRQALLAGDADRALAQVMLCRQKEVESHLPPERTTMVLMQEGFVQCALGRLGEAEDSFRRAGELSRGAQATPCHCHVHLTRALRHLGDGAHQEARAELLAGFTQARAINMTHFFRSLPATAAELCGAALDLDADAAFARSVIAARRFRCPDPGIGAWPWRLRMRLLGPMSIELEGERLKVARKAPKRLMDLIRLIAAWGGRNVDAARVTATLWPDAEGDDGRDALKAMLHRGRAVLGPDALNMRDGQISFNGGSTWLDTWAFEHVATRIEALAGAGSGRVSAEGELERRKMQLLALYRGHFLGEGEVMPWALPMRDRLRARFIRSTELLGQWLERGGRQAEAIDLYRAALEQDNLAEEIYQRLIACHLARGEPAQALSAYRRCRELLSIVLGLRPSARTEALVSGLRPS